jgi:hypothetical protein
LPKRYAVHVGKMWLESVAVGVTVGVDVCDAVWDDVRVFDEVIDAVTEEVCVCDGEPVAVFVGVSLAPNDTDAEGVRDAVIVFVAVEV